MPKHQCFNCKRVFTTPQGLGLHLKWSKKDPARLCPDHRTPIEKFLSSSLVRMSEQKLELGTLMEPFKNYKINPILYTKKTE